jgi:hypothetical protein
VAYVVKLVEIRNQQPITARSHPDFLLQYGTAVLLALAEAGCLTQEESLRCAENLRQQVDRLPGPVENASGEQEIPL